MRYRLAEHVSFTEVDDEAVLLDLNLGSYYGLNHIGARFLSAMQACQSVENAVSDIAEDFHMDAATVAADIDKLVKQLVSERLIEARN